MEKELLLGFDARVAEPSPWPSDRQGSYLLRPVETPRSVDWMCWPSIFDDETRARPQWIGAYLDLWEDLSALRANLAATPPRERCQIIAVTLHVRDGAGLPRFLFACSGGAEQDPLATEPPVRDASWRLLGFDVADGGGISGLSNCGYKTDARARIAPAWGPRVNAAHLFDDADEADLFREITDARVTEHAPFHVFGLWLVDG